MRRPSLGSLFRAVLPLTLAACTSRTTPAPTAPPQPPIDALVPADAGLAAAPSSGPAAGRYIFRHWTFGDEAFWTDTLHLNQVVETGVSPATALAVGLKV